MAPTAYNTGVGMGLENHEPCLESVFIFLLPPGIRTVNFDQCPFVAEAAKPSRALYSHVDLSRLQGKCHPSKRR